MIFIIGSCDQDEIPGSLCRFMDNDYRSNTISCSVSLRVGVSKTGECLHMVTRVSPSQLTEKERGLNFLESYNSG